MSGPPNAVLMEFAAAFAGRDRARCLDIGCGAARNAIPLATLGLDVVAIDLSTPMLRAAAARVGAVSPRPAVRLVRAPMAPLPFRDATFDLVVAHGIWNLARSDDEFRAAVREAARVARPGAGLFLFTFARETLPADVRPDAGETFAYSCWNGEPQCFLTERQIVTELSGAGWTRGSPEPLTAYNRRDAASVPVSGPPVIYEGTFIRRASAA